MVDYSICFPDTPRGVPRVDDKRVLNDIFWVWERLGVLCPIAMAPIPPGTTASTDGGRLGSGTLYSRP